MEPVIVNRVIALLTATSNAALESKTLNIRRFVNYFTIDVITYVLFGRPAGCLESGSDVVPAKSQDGQEYQAPLIDSLHASMRVSVPIGYAPAVMSVSRALVPYHPCFKQGKQFEDIVYYHVAKHYERVEKLDDPAKAEFEEGGFLRQLMFDKQGTRADISFNELLAECSGMINAGSDTTSTALSNTVYLLSQQKHKHILERLRIELTPIFEATPRSIPNFDSLSRAPFLRACIDETMRLRPSSAFGLPREVPEGGRWIAGQFVDQGVSVSVPTYSLLHNEEVFDKPDEYLPERWTDTPAGNKLDMMKKWCLPFSTGPRACIGRNIAYYEMTLVVATLLYYFDFEFSDPTVDGTYKVLERLNANPDELIMLPTQRILNAFNINM
ncbi:Fc.00g055550.m01.CDS01 [Cosmosporella sp. VM-42]